MKRAQLEISYDQIAFLLPWDAELLSIEDKPSVRLIRVHYCSESAPEVVKGGESPITRSI